MSAKTTLKWRAYPVRSEHAEALRCLTGRAFDADVPGRVGVAAADSTIELPEDLPDAPLDKAVTLLWAAAKVEHALMVQYLYASYSFAEPDRVLANVAIEEMSHLMTVQNLLRCLGQPPYLGRQDFRPPTQADERLFPFDLRLEPLSHKSLAKYVVAESPTSEAPDIEPDVPNGRCLLVVGLSAHLCVHRDAPLRGRLVDHRRNRCRVLCGSDLVLADPLANAAAVRDLSDHRGARRRFVEHCAAHGRTRRAGMRSIGDSRRLYRVLPQRQASRVRFRDRHGGRDRGGVAAGR